MHKNTIIIKNGNDHKKFARITIKIVCKGIYPFRISNNALSEAKMLSSSSVY